MSLRILVVDDDELTLTMFDRMLTKLHHEVDVVSSGIECEKVALSCQADVIFLDCKMPLQNGCVTAQHLRENGYRGYIILTSVVSLVRCEVEMCQADAFILKPVTVAILKEYLSPIVSV